MLCDILFNMSLRLYKNSRNLLPGLQNSWLFLCTRKYGDDSDKFELPPEPTNCCMSGCANCVWIEYATTLAKLFNDEGEKARKVILEKINDPNMKAFLSMELRNICLKENS